MKFFSLLDNLPIHPVGIVQELLAPGALGKVNTLLAARVITQTLVAQPHPTRL